MVILILVLLNTLISLGVGVASGLYLVYGVFSNNLVSMLLGAFFGFVFLAMVFITKSFLAICAQ